MPVSHERLCSFSGGDKSKEGFSRKTIHTDFEFAKECGLSTCIASGAMMLGCIIELFIENYGAIWLEKFTIRVKFIKMVKVDDAITPYIKIVNDGYEIWCRNQDGEAVVVGTASLRNA